MWLCSSEMTGSLLSTWLWMSVLEAFFLFATSGPVFYYYYARSNVTLEKWRYKSNPKVRFDPIKGPTEWSHYCLPVPQPREGEGRDSPDDEGDAVRLHLPGGVAGAGQVRLQPGLLWVGGPVCLLPRPLLPPHLGGQRPVRVPLPLPGPHRPQVLAAPQTPPRLPQSLAILRHC